MPYDDGRNSARARSARIRASHDYEATELESMRARTREAGEPRPGLVTRLASAVALMRRTNRDAAIVATAEREIESPASARLE